MSPCRVSRDSAWATAVKGRPRKSSKRQRRSPPRSMRRRTRPVTRADLDVVCDWTGMQKVSDGTTVASSFFDRKLDIMESEFTRSALKSGCYRGLQPNCRFQPLVKTCGPLKSSARNESFLKQSDAPQAATDVVVLESHSRSPSELFVAAV